MRIKHQEQIELILDMFGKNIFDLNSTELEKMDDILDSLVDNEDVDEDEDDDY